jgi:mycothiol synthase
MSELPAELHAGPLSMEDVSETTAMWRECEVVDQGEADANEADLVSIWQRPSFDFATQSVGVRSHGRLVAVATLWGRRRAFAVVLPSERGRGIGTWLLEWSEQACRAAGADGTLQAIPDAARDAVALLRAHGYAPHWESWVLEIALEEEPPPPAVPAGYAIRGFRPGEDERSAYEVLDTAFSEWPEQEPESFEDWKALTLGRPGFTAEDIALAVAGGSVVGAVGMTDDDGEGWVDRLAVARAHRGRGLGRALLQHAFAVTWRRGGRRCGLGTDSRTGARGLYEHVGMHVKRSYTEYYKAL